MRTKTSVPNSKERVFGQNNIKTYLQGIQYENAGCIHITQERNLWSVLVDVAMNPLVPPITGLGKFDETVILMTCIRCVRFESWPQHWLSLGFSWFSSDPSSKCWNVTAIRPRSFPGDSISIHCSSFIPPLDAILSQTLIAS